MWGIRYQFIVKETILNKSICVAQGHELNIIRQAGTQQMGQDAAETRRPIMGLEGVKAGDSCGGLC